MACCNSYTYIRYNTLTTLQKYPHTPHYHTGHHKQQEPSSLVCETFGHVHSRIPKHGREIVVDIGLVTPRIFVR